LLTLQKFLSRVVRSKTARKWVETIEKIVNRRLEASVGTETFSFSTPPPLIEWHLATTYEKFNLLTLSPLEVGRQITIMQAEIFRAIKPSELVGTVWVKRDKDKLSPNALRMMRLSTLLSFWYEKNICEALNFEERVAVYTRIVDILMVFIELNNFNGMMEILGALNSAPVHRLHLTAAELTPKRKEALQEMLDLTDDGHNMKYKEKLRSINPPCVPFLGMYLSSILKAEEGNPDFLTQKSLGDGLINFSKRRMVADITGEIQKYQNMPYNLQSQPLLRQYLEELDPLEGRSEKEMNDHLYELSLLIEPRNSKQPTKFLRKTDIALKSPGIKPTPNRSISLSRKSVSHDITESGNLDRKPPSPSPSTASTFKSFSIIEDESDDNEQYETAQPPPLPLPRIPAGDEKPPELPGRPSSNTITKQFNRPMSFSKQINRSYSINETTGNKPPPITPRQAKTPGFINAPVFDLPERFIDLEDELHPTTYQPQDPLPEHKPFPAPDRERVNRSVSEMGPPPALPPRSVKPNFKQRYSDSHLIHSNNDVRVPPQMPRRNTSDVISPPPVRLSRNNADVMLSPPPLPSRNSNDIISPSLVRNNNDERTPPQIPSRKPSHK